MTDEAKIRAALESRLSAMAGVITTAWENEDFTPPVDGAAYQMVRLMRAQPESPTIDTFRRHVGFLQVTICFPQSTGPGDAEDYAGTLAAWFPKRLSLTSGGVVVTIEGTPYVMPGFDDDERYVVPVRIPYFSNIST